MAVTCNAANAAGWFSVRFFFCSTFGPNLLRRDVTRPGTVVRERPQHQTRLVVWLCVGVVTGFDGIDGTVRPLLASIGCINWVRVLYMCRGPACETLAPPRQPGTVEPNTEKRPSVGISAPLMLTSDRPRIDSTPHTVPSQPWSGSWATALNRVDGPLGVQLQGSQREQFRLRRRLTGVGKMECWRAEAAYVRAVCSPLHPNRCVSS